MKRSFQFAPVLLGLALVSCRGPQQKNVEFAGLDPAGPPFQVAQPESFPVPDSLGGERLRGSILLELTIRSKGFVEYEIEQFSLNRDLLLPDQVFGRRVSIHGSETRSGIVGEDLREHYRQWVEGYFNACRFRVDTDHPAFQRGEPKSGSLEIRPNADRFSHAGAEPVRIEARPIPFSPSLRSGRITTAFGLDLRIDTSGAVIRYYPTRVAIVDSSREDFAYDSYVDSAEVAQNLARFRPWIDRFLEKAAIRVDRRHPYFGYESVFQKKVWIWFESETGEMSVTERYDQPI